MAIGDIFIEFLFGEGALIGLILLFVITSVASARVKYSSSFFILVWLFLAMEHLNRVTATTMHAWYFILSLFAIAFLGALFINDIKKK